MTRAQGIRWVAACLLLAIAAALRTVGVATGVLYGESRVTLATVVAIGAALVVVGLWPQRRVARGRRGQRRVAGADADSPRHEPRADSQPDRVSRVNLIVGTVAALVAALGLALPAYPTSAAEAACRGAPLRGAPFVATTREFGANARSGPGESFQQVARYSPNCSVGFEGVCLGEATSNVFFKGWMDNRWLAVLRHSGWTHLLAAALSGEPDETRFVAAAVVWPQSPESRLRPLDPSWCGRGAAPPPTRVAVTASRSGADVVLRARAEGAVNYGYALWLGPQATARAFRQIAAGDIAEATWHPRQTARALSTDTVVTVLAVPCFGPSAPADPSTAGALGFRLGPAGTVVPLPIAPAASPYVLERLVRVACMSPP